MPVPTHFKFVFRGEFVGTPEIWSFGVKFNRHVEGQADANIGDVNDGPITTAFDTFMAGGAEGFGTWARATDWRLYQIGTDGRMEGNPLFVDCTGLGIQGGAAPVYPPQIALVVTTVGDDRGPARFGRFYLPAPTATFAADGRLTVQKATDYATHVTTFLKAISAAIDLPLTVGSSSGVNISDRGGGVKQEIDHVEVGRVLDTLRSRRNHLLEERYVHTQIDW